LPTYIYLCESCGTKLEKFHGINESPCFLCPSCSGQLERQISGGAGFIFKGSGFYATDYRSESYKKAEKKDKDHEKGSSVKKDKDHEKGSSVKKKKEKDP